MQETRNVEQGENRGQCFSASCLSTLRNQDIGGSLLLLKERQRYTLSGRKYLDGEVQKDVWDMLVVRDGELKTKIARTEKRGRNYAETQILGAGDTVSQPATTGGLGEHLHPAQQYQAKINREVKKASREQHSLIMLTLPAQGECPPQAEDPRLRKISLPRHYTAARSVAVGRADGRSFSLSGKGKSAFDQPSGRYPP